MISCSAPSQVFSIEDFINCEDSVQKIPTKKVLQRTYNLIPSDDNIPVNIIDPCIKNGPWIAGGACLRWFERKPLGYSDIDVWCSSPHQARDLVNKFKQQPATFIKYESNNAVTIQVADPEVEPAKIWNVQVITKRYFSSLEEVVNSFDISICQIGTDGNQWILGNKTAYDINKKNIRFVNINPQSLQRLVKYIAYGFKPVDGEIEKIQSNPESIWLYNGGVDYENAF